jgi:Trypsin-like peptidase domain
VAFSQNSIYSRLAKVVGKLTLDLPSATGTISKDSCTGIAIADEYVLTVRHCLEDEFGGHRPYSRATITLGQMTESGGTTYELDLTPTEIGGEKIEDFVLFHTTMPIQEMSAGIIKPDEDESVAKDDLFILHQPEPSLLILTRYECHVGEPPFVGIFLNHTCDVEPGSSGAPIFNSKGELLGLHRQGGRNKDDPGSFNKGILLSGIRKANSRIDGIFANPAQQSGPVVEPTPSMTFSFANGGLIAKIGDKWIYRANSDDPGSPLIKQGGNKFHLIFWNPSRDILLEVPLQGGQVRSKGIDDPAWTQIGIAKRTI